MKILTLALFLALSVQAAESPSTPTVSLDEIELLVAKKSFSDAAFHLQSVPQNERTARFQTVAQKAILGHLAQMEGEKIPGGEQTATGYLVNYPFLRRSEPFMKKWREWVLAAYSDCRKNVGQSRDCLADLVQSAGEDKTTTAFVREAAALVEKHQGSAYALPVWHLLMKPTQPKEFCETPEIKKSLQLAAKLPAGGIRTLARRLQRGPCSH